MLKGILDQKTELRNYLFRRGYLLTNRTDIDTDQYPFYGNWNHTMITDHFMLYTHKEQKFHVYEDNGLQAVMVGHAYDPFTMKICEKEILADCTEAFQRGAIKTLEIAKVLGAKEAILKAKSPSCGCGKIYNGEFNRTLIEGDGLTARLLKENGIKVYTEEELDSLS